VPSTMLSEFAVVVSAVVVSATVVVVRFSAAVRSPLIPFVRPRSTRNTSTPTIAMQTIVTTVPLRTSFAWGDILSYLAGCTVCGIVEIVRYKMNNSI